MKIKELFRARDMTQGKPWHRIAEFAVPMLIGNIAQQLYNTADSIIVGIYIGDNALSAVGSAMPILNLLLALFIGVATGAGIVIAQYYGAKNREALSRTIGNCVTICFIATIITMILGAIITRPLLELLQTPASIIDWCTDYLMIFFMGSAGFIFYNIFSGILRGMGDSFSALAFLLLTTVLNIVLNIWFVAGLGMGVPGVSLATVISMAVSSVFCLIKLLKMKDAFDFKGRYLRLDKTISSQIIKLGIPSGITQAIMSLSMIIVQSLTNTLGEMVIAANVIIMRVDGFAMMPNMTFGQAMSVYAGQNVGAGRLDRVDKGFKQGMIMSVGCSIIITAALLLFGKNMFDWFTDTQSLIDLAYNMMSIMAVGYIAMAVTQILGGVMRGAGDTVTPMWISMITTVGTRMPTAYLFAYLMRTPEWPNGQPQALSFSLLTAWLLGATLSTIVFKRGGWRKKAQRAAEMAAVHRQSSGAGASK